MRAALLSILAVLAFTACSSQPLPKTDPKSVMAGVNFDPTRCVPEQNVYNCDQANSAAAGEASTRSDIQMIRGMCSDGYHYAKGQCVPND